ncbi:MarR family transcriptional regulator [Microbacterium bovistercoris]|uniref:MarR family transcriptional regulator n=1 Tax=Microbacterium bovistercoris TaxID=2293570 RepID=A0A371NPB6_9MICO|nr:MarR family transcriptional regulator [Microbacterium bovistercoris]REJ04026.1 MarR family transcriptional regulator [Microbacterium bovistercoris]
MEPLLLDRLLQIGELFEKDMSRAFEGTSLSTARVHLLWVLQDAGPSTQQTLARLCGVSPRNITGLVDALEASGHVRRTPHPTDRRAVLVELTEMSTTYMAQMRREHSDLDTELLDAVAPADREAVQRGVAAIANRLGELVADARGGTS